MNELGLSIKTLARTTGLSQTTAAVPPLVDGDDPPTLPATTMMTISATRERKPIGTLCRLGHDFRPFGGGGLLLSAE